MCSPHYKDGETEAGKASSFMGVFSQRLKRSHQMVLSFSNIHWFSPTPLTAAWWLPGPAETACTSRGGSIRPSPAGDARESDNHPRNHNHLRNEGSSDPAPCPILKESHNKGRETSFQSRAIEMKMGSRGLSRGREERTFWAEGTSAALRTFWKPNSSLCNWRRREESGGGTGIGVQAGLGPSGGRI